MSNLLFADINNKKYNTTCCSRFSTFLLIRHIAKRQLIPQKLIFPNLLLLLPSFPTAKYMHREW